MSPRGSAPGSETPNERRLDRLSTEKAKRYLRQGQFPVGSMGPKIQAAIHFVEFGGERAIITSTEKILEALEGKTGTQVCA